MNKRPIIVGADGTDSSTTAVRWAAREAGRRGLSLHVVHVLDWHWSDYRCDLGGAGLDTFVPAQAVAVAQTAAPGVRIDTDLLTGEPAERLLAAAEDAELLVVGHRGRGGFAGLLLGSVSRRAATHAPCPVVVVRGDADVPDAPIAVGIDNSPAADQVLATAFEAANADGCGLAFVHSYPSPLPPHLGAIPTPEHDAAERARLLAQLAPWRDKYPAVPVETLLSHDTPAAALTEISRNARLVVVGSHGHGVIAGTLLGSAGLQLLHHAHCPVHIVRPRPEEAMT